MTYRVYTFEQSKQMPVCDQGCCVLGFDDELKRPKGSVHAARPMYQVLSDIQPCSDIDCPCHEARK